jgi:hypothetical protein
MPTKFSWHWGGHTPDPAAIARREAREAAESHLSALQQPWREAAFGRSKNQEGAELHWLGTTVKPLTKKTEQRIADCQTDEERQLLVQEILAELRRPD